jgi:hypothetical protein
MDTKKCCICGKETTKVCEEIDYILPCGMPVCDKCKKEHFRRSHDFSNFKENVY